MLFFKCTCEITCTKLPWQYSAHVSAKMNAKFQNVMIEDVRALKDMLESPKTHKTAHQEGFYHVFC